MADPTALVSSGPHDDDDVLFSISPVQRIIALSYLCCGFNIVLILLHKTVTQQSYIFADQNKVLIDT